MLLCYSMDYKVVTIRHKASIFMQIKVKQVFCRALHIVFNKKRSIAAAGNLSLHKVFTSPSQLLVHSSPSLPVLVLSKVT